MIPNLMGRPFEEISFFIILSKSIALAITTLIVENLLPYDIYCWTKRVCNEWSEITTIPFSIAAPRTEGKTKWAKKKNCFSLATFHANSLFMEMI